MLKQSNYQLEKAKRKEAAFIVTFAKREQEVAELKVRELSELLFNNIPYFTGFPLPS